MRPILPAAMLCLWLATAVSVEGQGGTAPAIDVTLVESSIKFSVKASVAIQGKFDRWEAKLRFASPDVTTAKLEIKIQAASVNSGSGTKNNKLKGKEFFLCGRKPSDYFCVEQGGADGTDKF